MKILTITASYRRGGNSETLLDQAVLGLQGNDIKKVVVKDLNISPCINCQTCFKTGECAIKDDMQPLYKDLLEYDCLLVASPIHFQALPCKLKCVIDRCQAIWARKYVLKKPVADKDKNRKGAAILVCASKGAHNTFTGAINTLKAWFNTLEVHYKGEFLQEGLEDKDAAKNDKEALKRAEEFGKKFLKEE